MTPTLTATMTPTLTSTSTSTMTPTLTATMTPTLTSTSTATPPAQVYHDDVIQDWFDTSAWSPDTSTVYTDTTFTQTKSQQRNRHTYYTDYLGNVSGDAYPSDYRTVSQTVYGTKPLNPVNHDDVTRDWYDTSGWSPDASGTYTDETITQYKNQAQDHSTYTTNDRGDRYNEGTYVATRTIDQVVYGTKYRCYTRTWYYSQSDNYDYSDPENPVYVSTTYNINTGDYMRCDGATESFIVNITLDHPNDGGFYNHNACVRGSGSPSCN